MFAWGYRFERPEGEGIYEYKSEPTCVGICTVCNCVCCVYSGNTVLSSSSEDTTMVRSDCMWYSL